MKEGRKERNRVQADKKGAGISSKSAYSICMKGMGSAQDSRIRNLYRVGGDA